MILDIVIIIFIVFSVYSGYKRGLASLLVSLIGLVLAIVLAFALKTPVADFMIQNTDIDKSMTQSITDGINGALNSNTAENKEVSFYTELVKNMKGEQTVEVLSGNVVKFIIESAAFVIVFIAVMICTFVLQMMLNLVFDLPILSSINSIGGLGVGFVMAIFKIWVILAILSMLTPMFGGIKDFIDSTTITKLLYNTNFIVSILSSGLKF